MKSNIEMKMDLMAVSYTHLDVYKRQRGDSATGKTTLVDIIQEYVNNPTGSPVELICDKKCYCLLYTSRCVRDSSKSAIYCLSRFSASSNSLDV